MSIEFVAHIDESGEFKVAVTGVLKNDNTFEILPSSDESVVKCRFRANSMRERWPEDIELKFSSEQIAVVVHSATRQQREYLIELIERALSEIGWLGKLVEE